MDRAKVVTELQAYIQSVEKDMTLILQSLQWDRKHLMESPPLVSCRYNSHHRVPAKALAEHEARCVLRSDGYHPDDELLPDPPYDARDTLVKLGQTDIQKIIFEAAQSDPLFRRDGARPTASLLQPCSVSRLMTSYSRDERRAIYDAVVARAPQPADPLHPCDLTVGIPAITQVGEIKTKTRKEMMALERDMKRRRAKYRGAKCKNYSHTLREVIAAQMEMYTEMNIKVENDADNDVQSMAANIEPHTSQHTSTYSDQCELNRNYSRNEILYNETDKHQRRKKSDYNQRSFIDRHDKSLSRSTDINSKNRNREEYVSETYGFDARNSHDRNRKSMSRSQSHNHRYEEEHHHSSSSNRKSSGKHRDHSDKYSDLDDVHRNATDKYKETSDTYRNSCGKDRHRSSSVKYKTPSDVFKNTASSSKNDEKYSNYEKHHKRRRSRSPSKTKKEDTRSSHYDEPEIKEEANDDYSYESKRKRSKHKKSKNKRDDY